MTLPKYVTHVLGAERGIRRLVWRLKRLGIDPKMVLVHGVDEGVIEELMQSHRQPHEENL